ncbi:MAG: CDP-alcohol phosphatidyltransferase family protein [Clostridia bacterium]|nr:CDP-alcohol phosphatidyltransferase family protein [Clostridia bacterium]
MRHIPNILTVIRLLFVPLFVVLFFAVSPLVALPISWLAAITDVLDGYLARRNNWISRFGQMLDPVADKLMQGALLFALLFSGLLWWPLAIPFILKEVAQGVLGSLMLRRRSVVVVSRWYGKVALTLFHLAVNFTVVFSILLQPMPFGMKLTIGLLWLAALSLMIFAFISYLVCYSRMAAEIKKEWRKEPEVGN